MCYGGEVGWTVWVTRERKNLGSKGGKRCGPSLDSGCGKARPMG
jgi:hypothetical protein